MIGSGVGIGVVFVALISKLQTLIVIFPMILVYIVLFSCILILSNLVNCIILLNRIFFLSVSSVFMFLSFPLYSLA